MQGLHADEMEDVKAVPVKPRIRPAVQEPALPPRVPSAAKTLLLFDFDKTLTDWDAGAASASCQHLHARTACIQLSRLACCLRHQHAYQPG